MIYNIWKLLHVLAVIVFLGNITITIFWKLQAEKTKDRLKIGETFRNIIKADRYFTMPSVTFLIIFGMGTAMTRGLSLIETPWIFWSIILIIISAYSFMAKVVPLQKKIVKLTGDQEKFKWEDYAVLSKQWNLWGAAAAVAPYAAVVLMVLKV